MSAESAYSRRASDQVECTRVLQPAASLRLCAVGLLALPPTSTSAPEPYLWLNLTSRTTHSTGSILACRSTDPSHQRRTRTLGRTRHARPRLNLTRKSVLPFRSSLANRFFLPQRSDLRPSWSSAPTLRWDYSLAEVVHALCSSARCLPKLAAERARPRRVHRGQARRRLGQHWSRRSSDGAGQRCVGKWGLEDGVGTGKRPWAHLRRAFPSKPSLQARSPLKL